MPDKPKVSETQIQACLQQSYALTVNRLELLPLGLDANAWVYQVVDENGKAYFLKLKQREHYPASYLVPRFLKEEGLQAIVAPLSTSQNELWTQLDNLTVILYPFVEGHNGWKPPMSEQHWKELGHTLKEIQAVNLPSELFATVKKEAFDLQEYLKLKDFDRQLADWKIRSTTEREFISGWQTRRQAILTILGNMEKLAEILRDSPRPEVLCHADLHPGNVIITPDDKLFVIDWDEVMIAPKERDFLFVKIGDEEKISPAFFQGYGEVEIDWIALTYYLCERVVQDVGAFIQEIFFRPDLSEETKAASLGWFNSIFSPRDEVEATFKAARQLPSPLAF
jgi:spectinomycin phosphotransferase